MLSFFPLSNSSKFIRWNKGRQLSFFPLIWIHLIPVIPGVIAIVLAVKSITKLRKFIGLKINVISLGDGVYLEDTEASKRISLVHELKDIALSSLLAAIAVIISTLMELAISAAFCIV